MDTHAALYKQGQERIDYLRQFAQRQPLTLQQKMADLGISRRDFIKWTASVTAMLALPLPFSNLVAQAAELADRVPLIWLHMAECTGCSESLIRTDSPNLDTLIFDHISLEYHETLMAASGWQAEENLEHALETYKGRYLLAVEGAVPTANNGAFLTVGCKGHTGLH
ncbi:MAG: twin-arginine translocation signal domain-containing protein, partial [Shewanella sp.]